MQVMSVSRIGVVFRFDNDLLVEGELNRVFAPRTVEQIVRSLPLEGIVDVSDGLLYFPTDLALGAEKPVPRLQSGSIAYWPLCGGICLSLEPVVAKLNMSLIGRAMTDLGGLRVIRPGSSVRLSTRSVDPQPARS